MGRGPGWGPLLEAAVAAQVGFLWAWVPLAERLWRGRPSPPAGGSVKGATVGLWAAVQRSGC